MWSLKLSSTDRINVDFEGEEPTPLEIFDSIFDMQMGSVQEVEKAQLEGIQRLLQWDSRKHGEVLGYLRDAQNRAKFFNLSPVVTQALKDALTQIGG